MEVVFPMAIEEVRPGGNFFSNYIKKGMPMEPNGYCYPEMKYNEYPHLRNVDPPVVCKWWGRWYETPYVPPCASPLFETSPPIDGWFSYTPRTCSASPSQLCDFENEKSCDITMYTNEGYCANEFDKRTKTHKLKCDRGSPGPWELYELSENGTLVAKNLNMETRRTGVITGPDGVRRTGVIFGPRCVMQNDVLSCNAVRIPKCVVENDVLSCEWGKSGDTFQFRLDSEPTENGATVYRLYHDGHPCVREEDGTIRCSAAHSSGSDVFVRVV